MINIVITYHYEINDVNCSFDFRESELSIDGNIVLQLDDQYHDDPERQFEGFLKALGWAGIKYKLETKHINDIDY